MKRGGGFVVCIVAIRWRWRGSTVPRRELNGIPVWSGTEAGGEHSISPGRGLSQEQSARLTSTFFRLSGPQRWAKRFTARNYARGRQIHGVARRGNPRTKEGRQTGVQQLTWEERSAVGGETRGIWSRKWYVYFFPQKCNLRPGFWGRSELGENKKSESVEWNKTPKQHPDLRSMG